MGSGIIAETSKKLEEFVEKYKFSEWINMVPCEPDEKFDYEQWKKGMKWFQKYSACPGCQNGGGPPDCKIRACAKSKGVEVCASCSEMPCDTLKKASEHMLYDVIKASEEIKTKGKDAWLEEQKK